jgi:hypothetical protein|tara:strand:+ start:103 stop:273 length:171 start_codon:yes stop_codon:yes gene_type:complete
MDPSKISLNNVAKLFEYEKISREIDQCDDIDTLKNISKSYIKLYFAQQEVMLELNI